MSDDGAAALCFATGAAHQGRLPRPGPRADWRAGATESTAGPSRSTGVHKRDSSNPSGHGGHSSVSGASASGSAHGAATVTGQRHPSGPYQRPEGAPHTVKASSTTSLFTTRKNWSEHILQELQVRSTPCLSLSARSKVRSRLPVHHTDPRDWWEHRISCMSSPRKATSSSLPTRQRS